MSLMSKRTGNLLDISNYMEEVPPSPGSEAAAIGGEILSVVHEDEDRKVVDEEDEENGEKDPVDPLDEYTSVILSELRTEGRVGSGSQGVVEKMVHRKLNVPLAVKLIPLDKVGVSSGDGASQTEQDVAKIKMMKQELRTLKKCGKCRQIVKFYGCGTEEGYLYIILEWMDLGTLADILKQVGTIPETILSLMARDVLKGLKFLHRKLKVVHRDLKPANILINSSGLCKLSDMGVAGQMEATMDARTTFVGTLFYMSPERIQGLKYSFDSDIWSLGLILMECSLGRFPYVDKEGGRMLAEVLHPGSAENESSDKGQVDVAEVFNNIGIGFFDMLNKVKEAPSIQDFVQETGSSSAYQEFLNLAVEVDPSKRGLPKALLKTPFISRVADFKRESIILWLGGQAPPTV